MYRKRTGESTDQVPTHPKAQLLRKLGSSRIDLLPQMYTANQRPMHTWRPRWHHLAQYRMKRVQRLNTLTKCAPECPLSSVLTPTSTPLPSTHILHSNLNPPPLSDPPSDPGRGAVRPVRQSPSPLRSGSKDWAGLGRYVRSALSSHWYTKSLSGGGKGGLG